MYDMVVYSGLSTTPVAFRSFVHRSKSTKFLKSLEAFKVCLILLLHDSSRRPVRTFRSYVSDSSTFAVRKIRTTCCTICQDTGGVDTTTLMEAEITTILTLKDDEFDHPNNTLESSSVAIAGSQRGVFQTPHHQFCRSGYHHQSRHPPRTIENQSTDP